MSNIVGNQFGSMLFYMGNNKLGSNHIIMSILISNNFFSSGFMF